LPDWKLTIRKPSHSELMQKVTEFQNNENNFKEENKFSYLGSVVTNTDGEEENVKIEWQK
jgi:hypothetical protein